jgi:hypothetical protein
MPTLSKKDTHLFWPSLPYEEWKETLDTLHMWMQIVGKVKLSLAPFINQWWEVAFYITATGMTTGRIPYENGIFQVDFDFTHHKLFIYTNTKQKIIIPLKSYSVAQFYKKFIEAIILLGIHVVINPIPTEVTNPIPFVKDTIHASYDKKYVTRWWNILVQSSLVFDRFRSSFRGKSSPIQFFWGSFDLTGTRFSGKSATAPKIKGELGRIMRYAENEENFAFGFWPGDERYPNPAYYTYMYPQPKGFSLLNFGKYASFNEKLAECIFPYETIRTMPSPEKVLMQFLTGSYSESAKIAGWDINSLKTRVPIHRR